ncbi:MAG: nicotinate mononucleotide-dependent phosphoribosyltransferase CobT [Pseudanabaenaceae cyanobacterium]
MDKPVAAGVGLAAGADRGRQWLARVPAKIPAFVGILGFTETGLVPGISAAGATPADRRTTAIADAEVLVWGESRHFPLPPLGAGVSPVWITRAIGQRLGWPQQVWNSGLPQKPTVPHLDLGGQAARCVSTGMALPRPLVQRLWQAGWVWGEELARRYPWLVVGECVVGGTTTALAVLRALGWSGRVSGSLVEPNLPLKQSVVEQGLAALPPSADGLTIAAAVGDPMQPVAAGVAGGASRWGPVLLAGGTQMLAVWALAQTLAQEQHLTWQPQNVVVGTTPWVVGDRTAGAADLAEQLGVPLLYAPLAFGNSRHPGLAAYERGFVKEGVGAGGAAIAALLQGFTPTDIQGWVEDLLDA